jgi:hypothetical protein
MKNYLIKIFNMMKKLIIKLYKNKQLKIKTLIINLANRKMMLIQTNKIRIYIIF